jgi:hypothetical protein
MQAHVEPDKAKKSAERHEVQVTELVQDAQPIITEEQS